MDESPLTLRFEKREGHSDHQRRAHRCATEVRGAATGLFLVPPAGVEPAHMASEANALSTELRGLAGFWHTNGEFI